jgi:hypothetical protein
VVRRPVAYPRGGSPLYVFASATLGGPSDRCKARAREQSPFSSRKRSVDSSRREPLVDGSHEDRHVQIRLAWLPITAPDELVALVEAQL